MKVRGGYAILPEAGGGFVNFPETGGGFVNFPEVGAGGHDHVAHLKNLVPEHGALPEYFANICEGEGEFTKEQLQQAVQSQLDAGEYNANDWMGCAPSAWLPGGSAAPDYAMPGDASWEDINKEVQGWFGGLNKTALDWYKALNPEAASPPSEDVALGSSASFLTPAVPTWAIVGGIGAGVLLLVLALRK